VVSQLREHGDRGQDGLLAQRPVEAMEKGDGLVYASVDHAEVCVWATGLKKNNAELT